MSIDHVRGRGSGADELLASAQPERISKLHVHVHQQRGVVQRQVQLVRHGGQVYGRGFGSVLVRAGIAEGGRSGRRVQGTLSIVQSPIASFDRVRDNNIRLINNYQICFQQFFFSPSTLSNSYFHLLSGWKITFEFLVSIKL